jgi:hypothetical protein
MKNFVKITIACSLTIVLYGCHKSPISIEEWRKIDQEFDMNYVKQHPESTPLINKWKDCGLRKISAVEGCEEHMKLNQKEKDILNNYFKSYSEFIEVKYKEHYK